MSDFTIAMLGLAGFIIMLFLYTEIFILGIPLKEVFWRRRKK